MKEPREDRDRLEKKMDYLLDKVEDLEEKINSKGLNQPNDKLKIYETLVDANGNRVKKLGCKELRDLKDELEKREYMSSDKLQNFLEKKGYPRDKSQVRRIMRKLDKHFPYLEYRKGGAKKGYQGGKKSKLVYSNYSMD